MFNSIINNFYSKNIHNTLLGLSTIQLMFIGNFQCKSCLVFVCIFVLHWETKFRIFNKYEIMWFLYFSQWEWFSIFKRITLWCLSKGNGDQAPFPQNVTAMLSTPAAFSVQDFSYFCLDDWIEQTSWRPTVEDASFWH